MNTLAHLYLDIAALFDLRLATLSYIDQDFAVQVGRQPGYYLREVDTFSTAEHGELDPDIYSRVSDQYAHQLMHHMLPTAMVEWVRQWLSALLTAKTGSPFNGQVKLTVNIYPLALDEEDRQHLLTGFRAYWSDLPEIELITRVPETVRLDAGYTSMVLYNPVRILQANAALLESRRMNMLNVFVPKLNWGRALTDEERTQFKTNKQDIFKFLEDGLRDHLKLETLPVCMYCFDSDINPTNQ